jgi:hypothetical protein
MSPSPNMCQLSCSNCNVTGGVSHAFSYEILIGGSLLPSSDFNFFEIVLCDFCYQYSLSNTSFPLLGCDAEDAMDCLSLPQVHEDLFEEPEDGLCDACGSDVECSVHSIQYTMILGDFLYPTFRDFVFCETCLEKISREDFARVICSDDDDLLDNHIAPLF